MSFICFLCYHLLSPLEILFDNHIMLQLDPVQMLISLLFFVFDLLILLLVDLSDDLFSLESPLHVLSKHLFHSLFLGLLMLLLLLPNFLSEFASLEYFI